MLPQDGTGIRAPTPRKLNPASIKIAAAKFAAATTMMGPIALGSMCLNIILKSDRPSAFAAWTYSNSRNEINWPRTILATSTHMVSPIATNTCQNPFPNASVIAKTINKVGTDQTTCKNQLTTVSTTPPLYPAHAPRSSPINKLIATAIPATESEITLPAISRLKKSLPYLSLPSKNVKDSPSTFTSVPGGSKLRSRCWLLAFSEGSGRNMGPAIAILTHNMIQVPPMRASLFDMSSLQIFTVRSSEIQRHLALKKKEYMNTVGIWNG